MSITRQNHADHRPEDTGPSHPRTRRRGLVLTTAALAMLLAACGSDDPLGESEDTGGSEGTGESTSDEDPGEIVVGSQAYYSNEILAEIYAQALEADGHEVERRFNIGQRDAYMPELESGSIALFPEYTGNLLQYYSPETEARSTEDVYAELADALPENLAVLDQAEATDQDSYTVTREFAESNDLASIADLSSVDGSLVLGGPPELAERPYGPQGLLDVYGIEVEFSGTGDTTVESLLAGEIDVANVFTADPRIQTDDLVVLDDPESLFLASHVVPVVSESFPEDAAGVIDAVSAELSAEDLVALNVRSTEEEASAEDIAADWLAENDLG
ncbi:L-proline glycine betaine binding ABC transporter protein ProX (TC 3.A.1.12.1) [Actinomycetales bacterium JB111]|nr:L-proline glycine betaine binding ABC transporter protein ProX (TC 3.A.1.12.1) [Actinomycetales bacterium JB111]